MTKIIEVSEDQNTVKTDDGKEFLLNQKGEQR